jgi:hypothetical protein
MQMHEEQNVWKNKFKKEIIFIVDIYLNVALTRATSSTNTESDVMKDIHVAMAAITNAKCCCVQLLISFLHL